MKESVASVSRPVRSFRSPRGRALVRAGIAAGVVAVLTLCWLGFSAWVDGKVRGRLAAIGNTRGVSIGVEHVALRLGGVHVHGISVRTLAAQPGDPQMQADLDDIEVDVSWTGTPTEVRVRGGRVVAQGELDALRVRFARQETSEASGHGKGPVLDIAGLDLVWTSALLSVHASGAGTRTQPDGNRVLSAQQVSVSSNDAERGGELEARVLSLELGEGAMVLGARIDELSLTRAPAAPVVAPAAPPTDPAPFQFPWPDPSAWRQRLLALAERASAHLAEGAALRVEGLRVEIGHDLRFGPAPFRIQRRPGAIVAELSPAEDSSSPQRGATPLAFHVDVPLGAGNGDPTATLEGGPVPLSLLGFRDGQLFLHKTDSATLRGHGKLTLGEPVRVDVSVDVEHVGVEHPRISNVPIDDVSFGLDFRGTLSNRHEIVVEDAKLRSGELVVQLHGGLARGPEPADLIGNAALDIAHVSCEGLHQAVPKALAPRLADFRFAGDFAFSASVAFDTRTLDDLVLDVRQMGICRAVATPEWARRSHFEGEFTHTVYDPEGNPRDETTGPGTGKYTPIDRISPFMQVAVLTSEDGGFFHHHGWSKSAMRRAFIANLKAGRFRQGASTISMQLSKNLFLSRDKTLARKLEELVLTDYLEQTFDKPEMMELYLNIIEFGPDVYGITDAAHYYYGREPEELQLAECMFLASLLPSPVKRSRQRDKKELIGAARSGVDFLIRAAEKTGKIGRLEMEEGLTQPIVFHLHGDRPPPRAAVRGSRFEGDEPEIIESP